MKHHNIPYNDLIIFILASCIFGSFLYLQIPTDIQLHIARTQAMIARTIPPDANFLYLFFIYALALFSSNQLALSISSVIVLALATTAKFFITRRFLAINNDGKPKSNDPSSLLVLVFANLLLVAFSLPTSSVLKGYYYLGQTPPNIWHNPTTILLLPFAMMLFLVSHDQMVKPTRIRIFVITILCALNILIKPSFYFVFTVVYPLMMLKTVGIKKEFWINMFPLFLGAILLAGEYYWIYHFEGTIRGTTSVAVNPFFVWSYYSPNIVLSIIASILFPIAYLCFYHKDVLQNSLLQYAFLAYGVAVMLFAILTEVGARQFHANFSWQCIVCNYILFAVVSKQFLDKVKADGIIHWKNKIIFSAFLVQVLAGCLYLIKIFITKDYS